MTERKRLVEYLPDAYAKKITSFLSKFFETIEPEFAELRKTFERIEAWRNIDNAEGAVLDEIGYELGQPRGMATDEIYRIMLKSKTARDLSTGDRNTIIDVIAMALNADKSEIGILETWMDPDNPEPAGISLMKIPVRRLVEVGMSGKQFIQFVAAAVAAGVNVRQIELTGTFEYADGPDEFDEEAGFSDVNEPDVGGYYGELFEPDYDQDLPL